MTDKFIEFRKMSKKKQRELNNRKRVYWTLNPVTRKPDNPRAYKRKKTRDSDMGDEE